MRSVFDCYLVVRSWSVTLTCNRVLLYFDCKGFMAQKGKSSSNADAYDKYIMGGFRQFISDESLLSEKDQSSQLKKHWSNRMALLRRPAGKPNRCVN